MQPRLQGTMMGASDPQRMRLASLVPRCAQETDRFFSQRQAGSGDGPREHDPRFCFEIFRRALSKRDPLAWEAICRQYRRLVGKWVVGHPEFARSGGDLEDQVSRTFERLWAAVPPSRFDRFPDLRSILAYLKMCAHSAVIEDARQAAAFSHMVALDALPEETGLAPAAAIDSPVDRVAFAHELRDKLWNAVNSRLNDRERLVVRCLYELDLRPKSICDRYPGAFRDVREVYTIRQVVLERLARDPTLKALAGVMLENETFAR
jgi:DNA-directed RNA polymerase specialized sigma24 family protein